MASKSWKQRKMKNPTPPSSPIRGAASVKEEITELVSDFIQDFKYPEEKPEVCPYTKDLHCRWDDDKDAYVCSICDSTMNSEETTRMHMAGKRHQKKLATYELVNNVKTEEKQVKILRRPSTIRRIMCGNTTIIPTVKVTDRPEIQDSLDKIAKPILGLSYVTEVQRLYGDPLYHCSLCVADCQFVSILGHLLGIRHRTTYFAMNYPEIYRELKLSPFELERHCYEIEENFGRSEIVVEREISRNEAIFAELEVIDEPPKSIVVDCEETTSFIDGVCPTEEEFKSILTATVSFPPAERLELLHMVLNDVFEGELAQPTFDSNSLRRVCEMNSKIKMRCIRAALNSIDADTERRIDETLAAGDQSLADFHFPSPNVDIGVAMREVLDALAVRDDL